MKILTGFLRGREIGFKANPHLRPTGDKVRKAMFDTLGDAVRGTKVLDLFSGTGALGLEALSAGAAEVTFVESDKRQASKIEENLKTLGVEEKGSVLCLDAVRAIESLHWQGEVYDLIFLDPPYNEGWEKKTAEAIAKYPILTEKSWVMLEAAAKDAPSPENFGPLVKRREKIYGDTRVVFYGIIKKIKQETRS